jgi:hypothetical protein
MNYKTHQYIKITTGNSSFVIPPRLIEKIDPTQSVTFQSNTELLTGVANPSNTSFTILKPKSGQDTEISNFLERNYQWRLKKVEIFSSFDAGSSYKKVFEGLLFERTESRNSVSFVARGYIDLLNINLIETPLFRNRKVSTYIPNGSTDAQKFELLKEQNPTIVEGSTVGIINSILWLLGGRPYKYYSLFQPTSTYYSTLNYTPLFYYDCESSVINPEWVWFNYENLIGDLSLLCKASGGLLRQNDDGIIEYVNIFNLKKQVTSIVLTDKDFSDLTFGSYNYEPYKELVITFNPRFLSASQEVFSTIFDEYLSFNDEVERRVEFEKPVWKLVNKTISGQLTDTLVSTTYKTVEDNFTAVDLFGTNRQVSAKIQPHNTYYITKYVSTGTPGNFTLAKDTGVSSSQSTTVSVKNNIIVDQSSLYIATVKLFGRALDSAPEDNCILPITSSGVSSGFRQLNLGNNPYVQSKVQGFRFLDIAAYLMQNDRPSITLNQVPFNKNIKLGDIVRVVSTFADVDDYFKVYSYTVSTSLATADYELISVSGLYDESDLFVVGQTYSGSNEKILSF